MSTQSSASTPAHNLTDKAAAHQLDRLRSLQTEHRDLDEMLNRMSRDRLSDDAQIRRLKKRKLMIKDSINALEETLS